MMSYCFYCKCFCYKSLSKDRDADILVTVSSPLILAEKVLLNSDQSVKQHYWGDKKNNILMKLNRNEIT